MERDLFKDKIIKQLYDYRCDDFEQDLHDNNEGVKKADEDLANYMEYVIRTIKAYNIDDLIKNDLLKMIQEIDSLYFYHNERRFFEYFKWGASDKRKMYEEMLFGTQPLYDDTFFESADIDFFDYIEEQKRTYHVQSETYKKLSKEYSNIAEKYPNVIKVYEDREVIKLNEEEVKALIELREIVLAMDTIEEKLCFKLGVKEGLKF